MVDSLDRALGTLGISYATSLAIEGASSTGEYLDRDKPPMVSTFEDFWINLRTLIRNAINAFPTIDQISLSSETVIDAVKHDWDTVHELMPMYNPHVKTVLYLCTYEDLDTKFPLANFKNSNTTKQLHNESLERDTIAYFIENHKTELKLLNSSLAGDKRCVLLTHLPLDLLSASNFPKLSLLESHTGALKERRDWHTKLSIKKDGPVIPFNKTMLQIFGDGVTLAAQPIKIRKLLLAISEKRLWHPLTTQSKIMQDIKLSNDRNLLEFVNRYK